MVYQGPERRRHRAFITQNTEYHVRDNICIAVRDRRNGAWQRHHGAIGSAVMGGITITGAGAWKVTAGAPNVGEKLCFANDLMTTAVEQVLRPLRSEVDTYPSAALN